MQSLFPAPSPIPPSAQRAHSQGGRTLARGRPARQGPERAGTDSGRRSLRPGSAGHNVGSVGALDLSAGVDEARLRTFAANLGDRAARGRAWSWKRRPAGAVLTHVSPEFAPVEAARGEQGQAAELICRSPRGTSAARR